MLYSTHKFIENSQFHFAYFSWVNCTFLIDFLDYYAKNEPTF